MMTNTIRFLISLALLLISEIASGELHHSVGPLAICNGGDLSAHEYVQNCFQKCVKPDAPEGHGSLLIYGVVERSGGPKVVQCSKIRMSQTFTETWTFSQITSTPIVSMLPITFEECRAHLASECPDKNCNIRAPPNLMSEFHYASDTTIVRDYLNLISVPSGIDMLEDNIKITPMGSKISYPLSLGQGADDTSVYIWDPSEIKECPFTSAAVVGCDRYTGTVDSLVCRSSRITLDQFSKSVPLKGVCQDLKRSPSGLIFKWTEGDTQNRRDMKKLYLTAVTTTNQDAAHVRVQTNEALSVIDEDLCQIQCELLELVTRINLGKEILSRLGNSYVLATTEGYLKKCSPLITCRLAKPHYYCGSPVRIGVICDGQAMLWNPLKSYIENHTVCHKVSASEKLRMTVGNHIYDIADDMTINATASDSVGLSHDTLMISASSINNEIVDPREVRESWIGGDHRRSTEKDLAHEESHTVDHWDVVGEGWSFSIDLFRRVKDIVSKIYFIVAALATIFLLIWGYAKIRSIGARGQQLSGSRANRMLLEERGEPHWI
nr:TPA_asm: G [Morinda alphacytorhabdovirus 1_Ile]